MRLAGWVFKRRVCGNAGTEFDEEKRGEGKKRLVPIPKLRSRRKFCIEGRRWACLVGKSSENNQKYGQ